MKKFYGLLFAITAVSAWSVFAMETPLLKNGNFADISPVGLPMDWQLRVKATDTVEVKDGALLLKNAKKDESLFVIQNNLPLQGGKSYLLRYEVIAPAGAQYRIYAESMKMQDGKRISQSFAATWKQGDATEWRSMQEFFTFPAGWDAPYLAIQVKGDVPVTLRKLELSDASALAMFNSDFSVLAAGRPVNWELRGALPQFKFSPNHATLSPETGKGLWMIYKFASHQAGMTYLIRGEVRGTGESKYRVYYEWMQRDEAGKLLKSASSGSAFAVTPAEWTKFEKKITLPIEFSTSYLAINAEGTGTVEFRNIMVEAAESPDRVRAEAGGSWKFGKDSRSVTDSNNWSAVEVLPGAPSTLADVPVVPTKRYRLDFQTLGIGDADNDSGFHYFRLILSFNNNRKIEVPEDDVWRIAVQNKSFTFLVPEGADKLDIVCMTSPGAKVRFGGFKLEEQQAKPEDAFKMTLSAPAYRNTIYSSAPIAAVTGIADVPGAKQVAVELQMANEKRSAQVEKLADGRFSFSIPADGLPDGEHQLLMTVEMPDGKTYPISTKLTKLPSSKTEITGDGRGNFQVQSQPFFPIILMTADAPANDAGFYRIARSGFNVIRVLGTPDSLKKQLDLAQKYGLKLIVGFGHMGQTQEEYRLWSHQVYQTLRNDLPNHPALFGYFLVDEPAWVGVPSGFVIAGYELLKKIDPYHPVWINAAPRGDVAQHRLYATGSDAYGLDIYPVPYPNSHSALEDKGLTSVGKYTRQMREAAGPEKAVWMMLQGFAWETMKEKHNPDATIYPTMQETRFMVYDSLTSGANAIGYWGTQYIDKPEFYRELFEMATELHQLSGVFRNGTLVNEEKQGDVTIYTYQTSVGKVFLALNRSARPLTVTLDGKKQTLEAWDSVISAKQLPPPVGTLPEIQAELEKSNPFETLSLRRNSQYSESFGGKADWIWDVNSVKVPGSTSAAALVFDLDKLPAAAEIQAAADDRCKVFINGHEAGQSDIWTFMVRSSILPYLKVGQNVVVILGQDGGSLPCGIVGKVILDGQSLPTGKNWRATANFTPSDFTDPKKINAWPQAEVLHPYGSGPWSSSVRMPKKNKR